MRKYYIDNLRWMSLLWLIPYHTAMAWNVWREPNYIFFEENKLISSIVVFLSPYFMPLLFLLAGISTKYALQKRNFKQYLAERVNKQLIPLLFGTTVLMPILCYLGDKFNCGYNGGFLSHNTVFFTKYTDLTGADGGFSLGPVSADYFPCGCGYIENCREIPHKKACFISRCAVSWASSANFKRNSLHRRKKSCGISVHIFGGIFCIHR